MIRISSHCTISDCRKSVSNECLIKQLYWNVKIVDKEIENMKQLLDNRYPIILIICLLIKWVKSSPEWATTEDNKKYLIESKYEYTWFEALHECAKRNLSLVAIDTSKKNEYLVKLLKNRFGSGVDLWIGGTASTAENSQRKFVWVSNGKTFDFANWESGEPNNLFEAQPCVHTWSKTSEFTWADGQWHLKYGYICEETAIFNYQQDLQQKHQRIMDLFETLKLYIKKFLTDHIGIELDEKFEQIKHIIHRVFT
ncbi:lectin subunit alpha-like [Cochliomyia hominivorax]